MANRKRKEPQVILYKSWLATFIALNRDLNGQILEAISRHVVLGEDIEVDRAIRPLVESMLSDIDTNMTLYSDKCDTNKRTADKREQDKRNTNVAQTCNKRDTNVAQERHVISTSISTSTNTSISTNTSKEISPDGDIKKATSRFVPPTLDECRAYWKEKGFYSNPETFYNFYDSKGWMVGKNKMQKWKSSAAGWENRELNEHPEIKTKKNLDDYDFSFLEKEGII